MLSLPLFPCYLFVCGGIDRRLQVVTTPGVHTILYRGQYVAIIPEPEIDAIRRAAEGPLPVQPHPFIKCGTRVRITRGTLEGVEGILVREKNLCRLILSVEMLAQSVSVEVDASFVEPVAHRMATRVGEPVLSPDGRTHFIIGPWQVSNNSNRASVGRR